MLLVFKAHFQMQLTANLSEKVTRIIEKSI